ncbi:rhomboid-like protein [Streptomyces sp. NPDC001941]|uniref:rhomboid-like protein n=1 Tax=Streptomyces sp. NPDC001941 TaxID=3154659 RepID=UPI00332BE2AC
MAQTQSYEQSYATAAGGVRLLDAIPAQRGATLPASLATPWWRHALRLLPTPKGTPFTFGYALVLIGTSLYAQYGDPDTVDSLLRGSSTDVAHLVSSPLTVLLGSALWIAGGLTSPFALAFLFVLTALERRVGAWRTAALFALGHVVATLATEVPVGLSVVAGHLPASSLHRLDYGISFGLMASLGALAGLLRPLARTAVLAVVSLMVLQDLLAFSDPLSDWGHLLALLIGVASWPLARRWVGAYGSAAA